MSKSMLQNLLWSFGRAIPASPELMVEAVADYNIKIKGAIDKNVLTALSPFTLIDIEYEYAAQRSDGSWEDIPVVVSVGDGTRRLSYAEILWSLHSAAHEHLQDQDRHYFEGLVQRDKEVHPGIPAYVARLGR